MPASIVNLWPGCPAWRRCNRYLRCALFLKLRPCLCKFAHADRAGLWNICASRAEKYLLDFFQLQHSSSASIFEITQASDEPILLGPAAKIANSLLGGNIVFILDFKSCVCSFFNSLCSFGAIFGSRLSRANYKIVRTAIFT